MNGIDAEPIIEVFSETSFLDQCFKAPVGSRDNSDIYLHHLGPSYPLDFLLLEHPEKSHLHLLGTRLSRRERWCPCGPLKTAPPVSERPGKSALFVTEELAVDEGFRDRPAIYGDQGAAFTRRQVVDGIREDLFTAPRLAYQEDGAGQRRYLVYLVHHLFETEVGADDLGPYVFSKLVMEVPVVVSKGLLSASGAPDIAGC